MEITFRYAKREDVPMVYEFIHKLAVYEKYEDQLTVTEELLEEWMFERGFSEAIFVMVDGKEVGVSVYNTGYSGYLGTGILFIDELYVEEAYRGCGCGKALMKKMAEIALERDCERLEWLCLKWNPTYKFYEHMGAKPLTESVTFRATGEQLREMLKK